MSFMSFVGIQLPMDIDYDMAVEEVYIKVCSDQIQNCKGHPEAYEALAPLRFSRDKNKYRTLPSWVVDWTSYPRHNNHTNFGMPPKLSPDMVPWLHIESSPDLTGCRTVEPPTRMIGATRYNATKGLAGLRPSVSTAHVLSVSGMAIDRVCEITPAGGVAAWKLAQTWPIRDGARDKELRDRRSLVLRTLAADLLDKPVDWTQLAEFWGSLSAAFHVAETSIVEETNDGARTGPISLADVAMRVKDVQMAATGSEIKDEASAPSSENHVLNDPRAAASAKSSLPQTALKSLLVGSASRAPANSTQLEYDDVLSPSPDHIPSPTHYDQVSGDVIVVSSSRNGSEESSPFRVVSDQEDETIGDAEKDLPHYPQTYPDPQHKRQLATLNIPLDDEEEGSVPLDMPITRPNPVRRVVGADSTTVVLGYWRDSQHLMKPKSTQ
ncbi:hypothetical protein ACHAQH_010045 [Verticillium albo-atrum]